MKALKIGQVARQSGVGVETVRFYERRGLLEEPPRGASGYRQYGPDVVDRIRFIKRAKELGFTLKEINELLELRLDPEGNCDEVRRRAEQKILDIEIKLKQLRAMKRALSNLVCACSGGRQSDSCPILESLERPSQGKE